MYAMKEEDAKQRKDSDDKDAEIQKLYELLNNQAAELTRSQELNAIQAEQLVKLTENLFAQKLVNDLTKRSDGEVRRWTFVQEEYRKISRYDGEIERVIGGYKKLNDRASLEYASESNTSENVGRFVGGNDSSLITVAMTHFRRKDLDQDICVSVVDLPPNVLSELIEDDLFGSNAARFRDFMNQALLNLRILRGIFSLQNILDENYSAQLLDEVDVVQPILLLFLDDCVKAMLHQETVGCFRIAVASQSFQSDALLWKGARYPFAGKTDILISNPSKEEPRHSPPKETLQQSAVEASVARLSLSSHRQINESKTRAELSDCTAANIKDNGSMDVSSATALIEVKVAFGELRSNSKNEKAKDQLLIELRGLFHQRNDGRVVVGCLTDGLAMYLSWFDGTNHFISRRIVDAELFMLALLSLFLDWSHEKVKKCFEKLRAERVPNNEELPDRNDDPNPATAPRDRQDNRGDKKGGSASNKKSEKTKQRQAHGAENKKCAQIEILDDGEEDPKFRRLLEFSYSLLGPQRLDRVALDLSTTYDADKENQKISRHLREVLYIKRQAALRNQEDADI
jgi:hypothetical protein